MHENVLASHWPYEKINYLRFLKKYLRRKKTMPKKYRKQTNPFKIPAQDGKVIEEHFGVPSTDHKQFSIAHMIAPPGWSEHHQTPEFDEITIMIKGKKHIEVDGEAFDITAGETLFVEKGARVRYSNPHREPAEYWAVCIPAFTLETVHREE